MSDGGLFKDPEKKIDVTKRPAGGMPPPTPPAPGYGTGPVPPGAQVPHGGAPPVFGTPATGPAPIGGGLPGQYQLAPWGLRAVATIIDNVILIALFLVLAIPLTAAGVTIDSDAGLAALVLGVLAFTMIYVLAALLYAPLLMSRWNGQTVGRRAMGITVIRPSGKPMDFGWSLLREVAVKSVLIMGIGGSFTFGIAYLVDVLWPLWDDENRALHDLIVDTRVVRV